MRIIGLENQTIEELEHEVNSGGKFVIYQFSLSILVMSFKRSSDIYYVKAGESRVKKGVKFILLSLLLGWWGIPWGPIYTIGTLSNNFKGGKDVTTEVMQYLADAISKQNGVEEHPQLQSE